jgi:hypothetical protein
MNVISQLVKALELLRRGHIDGAYECVQNALEMLRGRDK